MVDYTRPISKGGVGFPFTDCDLTTTIEYTGDNPIYVGMAKPGTAKDEIGWQIRKLVYSGDNVIDVTWANGSSTFSFKWTERATYSYS